MSAMDDDQAQEDILELCAMVEEYKECFQIAETENRELKDQLQQALDEIERLHIVEAQQAEVIKRLDDSVNQLVEEIEQNTQIISAKDADLASLQHVLAVIHKRKVEIDDQTQLQQSRQIESLTAEKSKLSEAYSLNLKILEDYLDIINQKDSEILDLTHTIKQLELQIENTSSEESERKERLESLAAAALSPPTKSTSTSSNTSNPSPPATAPPSHYTKSSNNRPATAPAQKQARFTDNPSRNADALDRLAAARRIATGTTTTSTSYKAVDSEYSSDDNNEEEPSPVLPVTINRNRSTRMMRVNSASPSNSTSNSSYGSSGGSAGVSSVMGSLHSASMNNINVRTNALDTSSHKEAALSKYRRYVALNTTTTPTRSNNNSTYNTKPARAANDSNYASLSTDDVDVESSYIDNTHTAIDTTHSTNAKWSDVGKHERLFDKVDIIKSSDKHDTPTSTSTSASTTNTRRKSQPTTKPPPHDNYDIDPYTHPTLHTNTSSNNTSTRRTTDNAYNTSNLEDSNDSVEVFVHIDSNPPSPERTKPNKLFKPPFSKPVFNEFTHNTVKAKKSSSGISAKDDESGSSSSSWARRTASCSTDPATNASTSSAGTGSGNGSGVKKSIRSNQSDSDSRL